MIISSLSIQIIQEDFTENDNDFGNNDTSTEVLNEPTNTAAPNESSSQIINITSSDANDKITLETVWQGISSLQSSISNISNSLDTVSTQLNTFDPRINELESTLNTIKTKTTNFENVQNDVAGLRTELERITGDLEVLKTNQQQQPDKNNTGISEILTEIHEREFKSRNILIYNVPEDNLRISQDYSTMADINKFNALVAARDGSRAREILERIPNIDLDDIQTRRLGRPNPNFSRPLRVTLQSKDEVIMVMKNRILVNKPFNIKTDLTRFQQKKIKDLKIELDTINGDKNNPTHTIKFVNGEPQIIPIRRNYMKNE